MLLAQSTWREVEAYLERHRTILIPIGSMEQHGPTGLIGTDSICPAVIAEAAGGDDPELLIGPTFAVGCAQHHLAFPGSISLRPSTMIAALRDWAHSLRRHGFERIYWLNGHGGNVATIAAAFAEVYAERSLATPPQAPPPLRMQQRNWWEFPEVMACCKRLHPQGDGSHATASEVAVTYAAHPQRAALAATERLQPPTAGHGSFTDALHYRDSFPDGRIGSNPAQATAAAGEEIITCAAAALRRDYAAFCAAG